MQHRRTFLGTMAAAALSTPVQRPALAPDMLSAAYIVRRGARVHRRVEGQALTLQGLQPFDFQRPFRVASVSKMITTHGLLALVGAGRLDLDADVSALLGWRLRHPAFPETPITLAMLLSHTSGIRNGDAFPIPFNVSLRALLEHATVDKNGGWFSPASEPPGAFFAYSDANFPLVAEIMERVTGQRFDQFMHDTVFAPAGLDIGYNWSGVTQARRDRAAAGARRIDGAWKAQVDAQPPPAPDVALYRAAGDTISTLASVRMGENGFAFAPHGGLRLSLADMDALARRLMRSRLTHAQAAPRWTFTPAAPNGATENGFFRAYGLGMHVPVGAGSDSYFGATSGDWRGHFGDAYGWMTGLWWNAKADATLVWAVNGMPETGRIQSARTALTAAEQGVVDAALAEIGFK